MASSCFFDHQQEGNSTVLEFFPRAYVRDVLSTAVCTATLFPFLVVISSLATLFQGSGVFSFSGFMFLSTFLLAYLYFSYLEAHIIRPVRECGYYCFNLYSFSNYLYTHLFSWPMRIYLIPFARCYFLFVSSFCILFLLENASFQLSVSYSSLVSAPYWLKYILQYF